MIETMLAYTPLLLRSAALTFWLSCVAMVISSAIGFVLALALRQPHVIKIAAVLYIECFRSMPILILLFFCYYGVPLVFGFDVSSFAAATAALALHNSALMSQVFHSGIDSVGKGQVEAAQASGMLPRQIMWHVIRPQAMQVILPPAVGVYTMVLKESSVASIIGYAELTRTGMLIRESTNLGFYIIAAVAVLYFIFGYVVSLAGAKIEKRMSKYRPGVLGAS